MNDTIFLSSKEFYQKLNFDRKLNGIKFLDIEHLDEKKWKEIKECLGKGEDLFFVGIRGIERLQEIWIQSYKETGILPKLEFSSSFSFQLKDKLKSSACRYVYIRPPKQYTYHGIDEEIRANIYPIIEAKDRFGNTIGYPAVMVKNYASSLVVRRFKGGRWFIFLFERPEDVMSAIQWKKLFSNILSHYKEKIYIARLYSEYVSYRIGEKIKLECRIVNLEKDIISTITKFEMLGDDGKMAEYIGEVRGCLNPNEEVILSIDWYPKRKADFYKIKASLFREDRYVYGEAREKQIKLLDCEECGVVIYQPDKKGLEVEVEGTNLKINNKEGFFVGTHYYPSSSWYDWVWRDFRPDKARQDFEAMRKIGIRLLRIWVDPVLDEATLRAMDACIQLCQVNGIVPILTIFTDWIRWLEINVPGCREKGTVMNWDGYTLEGLYFHNIEFQCKYVKVLANRYKGIPGLIWDISNEFAVINPDDKQIDNSWVNKSYKRLKPPYNNINLFIQWAEKIKNAILDCGGGQPVIIGMGCWDAGTDNYLSTKNADVISWHTYAPPDIAAKTTSMYDVTCISKPLLIEEFGINTYDEMKRFEHYDAALHYFLGTRTAGACSYEWGVSWLTPELPFIPTYVKGHCVSKKYDVRWMKGWYEYAKSWPEGSIGICPWTGSFCYGMNYPCTSFSTPAIRAMQKISWIGEDLAYYPKPKKVYLVIPMEFTKFIPHKGYHRKTKLLFKILTELWANGVIYGVSQEDMLENLPDTTRMIIFPNEDRLKEKTKNILGKLQERGIKVYLGEDMSWKKDNDLEKVDFIPREDIYVLSRDIKEGALYFLGNLKRDLRKLNLSIGGYRLELELNKFGLVREVGSRILMVECQGLLSIDGKEVADSGGKRYIIKSLDKEDLSKSKELLVIPWEPMELKIGRGFKRAQIVDREGKNLGGISLKTVLRSRIISIDKEMNNYGIKIY